MTQFTIREGDESEIIDFGLYNEDNAGSQILVAEMDNEVVAFAQCDGTTVYMLESNVPGAGRAIVEYILDGADYACADNVDTVSEGFWAKMGFQRSGGNMEWYSEE